MSEEQDTPLFPSRPRQKANEPIGQLLMLSSGFIFAVMDCLIKYLGPSYRVWDIAFYRFGCGMAILLLIFGWRGNPFRGRNRKLLILRGIAGSMAFLSIVIAIRLIPISTAMVLFYSFPAFAAIFSSAPFRGRMTKELLLAFVALCGVAVILDFRLESGVVGQAMSLLGAVFAAVALNTLKKARETNGPVIIYLYFCLTGTLISFFPFVLDPQLPASAHDWLVVGGIVGTSLTAQLLMNQGLYYCQSCEGGILLTSEVLFVALWGFVFLNETVAWRFWTGGAMILGSIIFLIQNPQQDPC